MNEEHSRPFTPVLLSSPSSFLWLRPHPASSATFMRGHTHTHTSAMHKCTYINTKPVAHTKQVFILSDVSLLSMFLHLCVCICVYVCVHAGISSLERVTNHKHTSFSLSIFFSSSPSLYFFSPLSAVDHERKAQPFLQIPALTSPENCYIHVHSS